MRCGPLRRTALVKMALRRNPQQWAPVQEMVDDSVWLDSKYGHAFSALFDRALVRIAACERRRWFNAWRQHFKQARRLQLAASVWAHHHPQVQETTPTYPPIHVGESTPTAPHCL